MRRQADAKTISPGGPLKTADIPPALLPGNHLEAPGEAQGTVRLPAAGVLAAPRPAGTWKPWLGGGILLLLLAAGAATWFFWPRIQAKGGAADEAQAPSAPPEAVPPELRSYMAQARGGDAKAMHLIALMYWNGLNVPQDRVKGLDWYHKAAGAGDKAAQKELSVIEGK